MRCPQELQFRFYCSEISFFDQSLTFIFLNLKPKSPIFRTEIRFPVSSENRKNDRNFGLSDRNGEPWCSGNALAALNNYLARTVERTTMLSSYCRSISDLLARQSITECIQACTWTVGSIHACVYDTDRCMSAACNVDNNIIIKHAYRRSQSGGSPGGWRRG